MNDQMQAILAGVVRHGIGALGAYIAAHGITITGGQMDTLTGAVMVLIALGWSAWQKRATIPATKS